MHLILSFGSSNRKQKLPRELNYGTYYIDMIYRVHDHHGLRDGRGFPEFLRTKLLDLDWSCSTTVFLTSFQEFAYTRELLYTACEMEIDTHAINSQERS